MNSTPRLSLLYADLTIELIKKVAHEKEVSITVFLVSVYLFLLQEISKELKEPGNVGNKCVNKKGTKKKFNRANWLHLYNYI